MIDTIEINDGCRIINYDEQIIKNKKETMFIKEQRFIDNDTVSFRHNKDTIFIRFRYNIFHNHKKYKTAINDMFKIIGILRQGVNAVKILIFSKNKLYFVKQIKFDEDGKIIGFDIVDKDPKPTIHTLFKGDVLDMTPSVETAEVVNQSEKLS